MVVLPMSCKTVDTPMTTQNGAGFSLSNCVVFFELVGLAYSNLGSIDFIMDANLNYVIKLFI